MLSRSRFVGIFVCFLLGGSALLAQDATARYSGDRSYRQDSDHRDSGRECDRDHPQTSKLDYLYLPGFPGARGTVGVAVNAAVNAVSIMPFHLDRYFRVGHVGLSISVAQPGSHAYVGIYDAHRNLLVQGKIPTDEAGNIKVEISPRVLLKPGIYYFAIGGEDSTAQAVGYLFDTGDLRFTRSGVATNQIMDGSLPATLGPLTGPLQGSTASAVFTP